MVFAIRDFKVGRGQNLQKPKNNNHKNGKPLSKPEKNQFKLKILLALRVQRPNFKS